MTQSGFLLLSRLALCLSLTTCLWLTSIVFRTGGQTSGEYYSFGIAAASFVIGVYRLYITQPVSTVLICGCCIIIITAVDQTWDTWGYFDDYKNVKSYTAYISIASATLMLTSFLYKLRARPRIRDLVLCWIALLLEIFAIGTHIVISDYGMIGTRYIVIVFISLAFAEIMRLYQKYVLRNSRYPQEAEAKTTVTN